jgi:hypothetical protein
MTPVASTAFPSQVATTIVVITALQPPRNDHATRMCAALKEYHQNLEKGCSTVNSSNGVIILSNGILQTFTHNAPLTPSMQCYLHF